MRAAFADIQVEAHMYAEAAPTLEDIETFDLELLCPISESDLGMKFDELVGMALAQPDSDFALQGLRQLMVEVKRLGHINVAMQMAATIGATACMHQHMEGLASDVDALFRNDNLLEEYEYGHTHSEDEDEDDEDEEERSNSYKSKMKYLRKSVPRKK